MAFLSFRALLFTPLVLLLACLLMVGGPLVSLRLDALNGMMKAILPLGLRRGLGNMKPGTGHFETVPVHAVPDYLCFSLFAPFFAIFFFFFFLFIVLVFLFLFFFCLPSSSSSSINHYVLLRHYRLLFLTVITERDCPFRIHCCEGANNFLLLFEQGLHVILCGTGSPMDPTLAGSCTLVIADGKAIGIDMGQGGWENIAKWGNKGLNFVGANLEGIFLTHFHSDHIDSLDMVCILCSFPIPTFFFFFLVAQSICPR